MEIIAAQKRSLKPILRFLKEGRVLVFPTDTVYGLLCDSTNKEAVKEIFKIKKREKTKPLAVFVKDIATAKKIACINKKQERFFKNNKITAILKAKKPHKLSPLVYKKGAIGIRIPKYRLLNLVLDKFEKPIAQTSANIAGRPAMTKIKEVLNQFAKQKARSDLALLIIDAGNLPKNKPSKVINLINNKIIRP